MQREAPDDGEGRQTRGPDGLQRLWTPHRMAYIKGENKPKGTAAGEDCPFCRAPGLPDEEGLVLARGKTAFALLNLYPYNSGHLMVCPYRHVADYTELDETETAEIASLTQAGITALRSAYGAQGCNVGMNLGVAAGAGIAAHLHQHVVPRWGGDTNFMPVVGQTKVLPEMLDQTREQLVAHWPRP
ncbi:HIT family protein [Thermobifida cellulosilytica]|jgi:Diadenosine tetraphosphate (Ap4A) hydrolase and other HIT family hydrolases|uniref:HIT family hydrolase n=1 Tax=Thermobifida cellulosilytica TB100 TaxID=665004 RepID=A0A147KFN6_THECS|nr:HIT domain-containing protein [Thermobifida cellulosilytica]KUP96103.1 HIT family hydrolase [Thermobifida cellulosilytica TB100]